MQTIILALASLIVFSCGPFPGDDSALATVAINGVNDTAVRLTFEMDIGDRVLPVDPGFLDAGRAGPIAYLRRYQSERLDFDSNGCSKGELVALDPRGEEVARHPPGLCYGETWTIEPRALQ